MRKHAKGRGGDLRVQRGGEPEPQHHARIDRVDHAVVPQACGGEVRAALGLVAVEDRRGERFALLVRHVAAFALQVVQAHLQQHAGGLLAAHDADARVRPHPQLARVVAAAAHAVVARAEAAADDHRELGHLGIGDGHDHLGPVAREPAVLVLAADHEPGDVLQEHQRQSSLTTQLDKMRAFQAAFAEQNAIVGDDADRDSP